MNTEENKSDARQRILDKAEGLFYQNGIRATGINQIIAESGVAKATFYAHFESKDALCLAYLERMSRRELSLFEEEVSKRRTPLSKYMTLAELVVPWLVETEFRGCGFLNIVPEEPNFGSPMRQLGSEFYNKCELLVERCVKELIETDPKKYKNLNPKRVASDYMNIFSGGIALCEIHHRIEPMKNAVRMIKELIEKE